MQQSFLLQWFNKYVKGTSILLAYILNSLAYPWNFSVIFSEVTNRHNSYINEMAEMQCIFIMYRR